MTLKIAGIDPSIDSTGKCIMTLNDNYDVIDIAFYGYNSVKKRCFKENNVEVFHVGTKYKKMNMHDRQNIAYEYLKKDMEDIKYVAFEGYALAKKHTRSLVQLGEFIGGMKKMYYDMGIGIIIYAPRMVKRFATGDGNAEKVHMCRMFQEEYTDLYPREFKKLTPYIDPHGDMCDAFWMAETLRCQIMYEKLGREAMDEGIVAFLEHKSTPKTASIIETKMIRKEMN